jgi:hypothetical protein
LCGKSIDFEFIFGTNHGQIQIKKTVNPYYASFYGFVERRMRDYKKCNPIKGIISNYKIPILPVFIFATP